MKKETKVYGKLESDLVELGIKDTRLYVKLIEDFSEMNKRIECTFEALSSRLALDFTIEVFNKLRIDSDNLRNTNWIYLSYTCTEFTNLFHGDTNGFPRLYDKLLNSLNGNKFPAYKGIDINQKEIEENNKVFKKLEEMYAIEIMEIKTGRDKTFSHVDKNQFVDLPSTQIMIRIIHQLNSIFIDLYKKLGFISVRNNTYTKKKEPVEFTKSIIISKVRFFLFFLLRDRKDSGKIIDAVIESLNLRLDEIFAK